MEQLRVYIHDILLHKCIHSSFVQHASAGANKVMVMSPAREKVSRYVLTWERIKIKSQDLANGSTVYTIGNLIREIGLQLKTGSWLYLILGLFSALALKTNKSLRHRAGSSGANWLCQPSIWGQMSYEEFWRCATWATCTTCETYTYNLCNLCILCNLYIATSRAGRLAQKLSTRWKACECCVRARHLFTLW